MTLQECYALLGGDYEGTQARLPSERIIQKFLLKFPSDGSYALLLEGITERDGSKAFRAAHTLKGVALNLGLTALHAPASALAEALRPGTWNDAALPLMPAMTEQYERPIRAIRQSQIRL